MRYDSFIIWGNGINHSEEIINIIASEYKVLFAKTIYFDDTNSFINSVYECDSVPIEHLIAKSRYLLKSEKKCIYILIENHNPDEQLVGDGPYRHIQCLNLQKFKFKIREKFNPKHPNPNFQVNPLPTGVSHDHVIHSTDYESQVFFLNKLFNCPDIQRTKLDVMKFFLDMPEYVVIRKDEHFPMYQTYKDVDFIVKNKEKAIEHIMKVGQEVKWDGSIKQTVCNSNQTHIDFHLQDGSLDFRFDVYSKLDYDLDIDVVFDGRRLLNGVYIPCEEIDNKIKGLEYLKNPTKIKYKPFEKYAR